MQVNLPHQFFSLNLRSFVQKVISLIIVSMILGCSAKDQSNLSRIEINLDVDSNYSPLYHSIKNYFQNKYEKKQFNGAVLFAEDGKVIYKDALGFANIDSKEKLEVNSRFQLASVSKTITATAIAILEQEGKLNFDDDFKKYFPDFPYENITIKMLLSHRSGLPNYMYFCDQLLNDEQKSAGITNDDVLKLMIKHKPNVYYQPDKKYNYSNTNYALLALVIEKVSRQSYEDFLQTAIFNKAGMNDTKVYRKNKNRYPSNVFGYRGYNRQVEDNYLNGVVGDKGIFSTIEDLYKFDYALRHEVLIKSETLEKIYTPQHPEIKIKDNYGLGWRIHIKENGGKIAYHGGWWKGFRSYFIRDLDSNKTIIVLKNSNLGGRIRFHELLQLFNIESYEDEEIQTELDSLLVD